MANSIPFVQVDSGAWFWYVPGVGWQSTSTQSVASLVKSVIGGGLAVDITAAQWATIQTAIPNPTGGIADENVLDDSEGEQLFTAYANNVNAHTTAAKEEILTAIENLTPSE